MSRAATLLVLAALVGGVLLVLRGVVAEPLRIPSDSMAPTLERGDHVLVDKRAYDHARPRRGDLAVFRAPSGGGLMLKRVVAVAGQTVGLEDGALVVDRRRLDEPYADRKAIDSVYFGPVRVWPGTVFVLGDNRADSSDSRTLGAVPLASLVGRVKMRIWPPSRWGTPR